MTQSNSFQPDDLAAFFAEMSDVAPLPEADKVAIKQHDPFAQAKQLKRNALEKEASPQKYGLSLEISHPIDPYDVISYKQDGIQEGVFKNLRLGKYPIETRLNLTQMSIEQARDALIESIETSFNHGVRVMIIQHGIGLKSKPIPAKLKSYINLWLPTLPQVIAFHSAHKSHGGLASTYVMMKKNPQQKLINREKHAKRFSS